MSGISVPFIEGSVAEYSHGLDRLDSAARPRVRSIVVEWTRTLATCALLVAALTEILPWLPDTLRGEQAAGAAADPLPAPSVPAAARVPAVVRLDAGAAAQPTMTPTEHQITANAALDKLTEAAIASPAARMLKF